MALVFVSITILAVSAFGSSLVKNESGKIYVTCMGTSIGALAGLVSLLIPIETIQTFFLFLFCEECVAVCPDKAIEYTQNLSMSVRERNDLLLKGEELKLANALDEKTRKLFGRSLKLRVVTAGSCAGCEMELMTIIEFFRGSLSNFKCRILQWS